MSEMSDFLKALAVGLKSFADGIESVAEKMGDLTEFEKPPKKAGSKSAAKRQTRKTTAAGGRRKYSRRSRRISNTDLVYQTILEAENGIDLEELCIVTGLDKQKLHGIVYRLKNQEKISTPQKGYYKVETETEQPQSEAPPSTE